MDFKRRSVLRGAGAAGAIVAAATAGLVKPFAALAAPFNKAAHEAKNTADAMKALGVASPAESKDIVIKAPDIAENGAVVPIEIESKIPNTESIAVFIDKNPFPFVGSFDVSKSGVPFVAIRVKVGESSPVRVVAMAGGKAYTTAKEVKVTIGGCGG